MSGLKVGAHQFEYKIDQTFLSHFEDAPVKEGLVQVKLDLDKRPSLISLDFTFSGFIQVACDRCLDHFELAIEGEKNILIKRAEKPREEGDIIFIRPETDEYNIAQLVYELIVLGLPMQNIHPEDENGESGCDPEILKYIQVDFSEENPEKESNSNPIWDQIQEQFKNKE